MDKPKEKSKPIHLVWPLPEFDADGNPTGGEIKILRFGRAKAKHFRALPKDFFERAGQMALAKKDGDEEAMEQLVSASPDELIPVIAALSGVSEKSIDELDIEDDFPKVMEAMESFFDSSSLTGETES